MRSKRLAESTAPAITPEALAETETFRLLSEVEPERRNKVLAHLKLADDGKSPAHRIAWKLLEPGHVDSLWESADPIERVLLRAASASAKLIGRGTLMRCALDRRHSPAEVEQRIARLEKEGVLLWRDVGFTPGYLVPSEVATRLRACARAEMSGPAAVAKPTGPIVDQAGAFLDDVVTTLAFLKRGAYRVTRGGAVHAADLRRLASRLVYSEDVPNGDVPSPATGEPFPTRLGLALDLARRLLLVRFDPDEVKVDAKRVKAWLDRPADEVRRDLLKAARREPWRHQREVSAVAEFLSEREPMQWTFIEDVARALEYHPDFLGCRPEQLRARVQSGATYLCYLGAAALSPEELRPDAVALTPLGKRLLSDDPLPAVAAEDGKLHVLPTFEVILPTAASLVTRYALEVFSDPEPGGHGPVRRYKLDKRAVLQALKGGLALDEITGFLKSIADEIPENVRISLEEWSRSYGEYYFMNPTLLVCRDAAAAAAAKSDPKISERVLGSLTPEILILGEGAIEPVRAALEGSGSMPRAGIEEIPPGAAPVSGRAATVAAISRFLLKRASDRALVESTDELDLRKPADKPEGAEIGALPSVEAGDKPADAPPNGEDRRSSKLCAITGCGRPHAARGLCTLHYQAARRGKISFPSL